MGDYEKEFKRQEEKGKTVLATEDIYTWTEEEQVLFGRIQEILPFTDGKFDTDVLRYVIDTDAGRISTVLGAATDKQLATKIKPGDIVKITFKGKKHLEDGRQVNRFDVRIAK